MKEVKHHPYKLNFYLTIYFYIHLHKKLPSCSMLNISTQNRQHYVTRLKKHDFIKRTGYGVWEIVNKINYEEQVKILEKMPMGRSQPFKKGINKTFKNESNEKKDIRGHGFQFKFLIPKIPLWHKREDALRSKKITFQSRLGYTSIKARGWTMWLCKKSVILYSPKDKSYLRQTAKESKQYAIYDAIQKIKWVERQLGISFLINKEYKMFITRQHYGHIGNELAKQYNRQGKQLEVRYEGKLWLITDFSLKVDEAETIHPVTSEKDMDKVIKPFFNDLKEFYQKTGETLIPSQHFQLSTSNTKNIQLIIHHLEMEQEDRRKIWFILKQILEGKL